MASKTTYIPRYLLPQYGALWRTATRSTAITRPLNAELGQVLVRYASKTATSKATPAAKVVAPKAASTKASSKSAASKAAKHSAPTKPPAKTTTTKSSTTKAAPKVAPVAAAVPKTPVPKTPTPPAVPKSAAPTPKPAVKTDAAPETPPPAAKPAAAVDPSKPLVLEKPERFNPPSHGARLPRSTPKHYGGAMSDAEIQAQTVKTYPGLPPPPNTWTHWFIHSRGIHLLITLGTLTSLAVYTFMENFKATSPYADMVPPISEFPRHPFQYIGVLIDILKLNVERESAITAEKRRQRVEDVAKRNEYRKAHGLEPATGFLWAKADDSGNKLESVEAQPTVEPTPVPAAQPVERQPEASPAAEFTPEGKRKKFLGIF
ncbi:hypothetical protein F5Y04DRAFT_245590 [Hypomontagnella monticulosa]|nr:hypothetical protein F5Y04DRAFT_245590 [Hypomontagnella monticulosa]